MLARLTFMLPRRPSRRASEISGGVAKRTYMTATQDDDDREEAPDHELHLGRCVVQIGEILVCAVGGPDATSIIYSSVLQDGTQFSGELRGKKPEGYGVAKHPDGNVYSGKFVAGLQHGIGVLRSKVGDLEQIYRGEWLKGSKNGFGIESISDPRNGHLSHKLTEYDVGNVVAAEPCTEGVCCIRDASGGNSGTRELHTLNFTSGGCCVLPVLVLKSCKHVCKLLS